MYILIDELEKHIKLLEDVSSLKEDSENMQYYRNAQKVDLAILKGILKRYRERERDFEDKKFKF